MTIEYNLDQLLVEFGYDENQVVDDLQRNLYHCIHCSEDALSIYDGIIVCLNCNCEYGNIIDDSAEWRSYGCDDNRPGDPSRCASVGNPLLIESSYGTTMGFIKTGYFNRLKKINLWNSMPCYERSLKLVFDRLTQDGLNNGLTNNIIEFSHKLFAEVIKIQSSIGETRLSRGDNRDGLIGACLFYSCKEHGVSRSPQEIAKICDVNPCDMTKGINLFYELMKDSKLIDVNKFITKYDDFIDRYCGNLGINPTMVTEIIHFCKTVDEKKILTKNTPQAMTSACIYFVSVMYNLGLTKTQISEKCGISVTTINKAYEKLLVHIPILI